MKLFSTVALALLAFSGLSASAQAQQFEGLIVNRIEAAGGVVQQKVWVRGDSVVIEAQAPMPDRSFANFSTRELKVYVDKKAQVYPLNGFDPYRKKTNHLQVQPETKKINGKTAQLYTIEIQMKDGKMMKTAFWLTADFPENVRNTIDRNLLIGSNDDVMFREIAAEIFDMGLAPVMISVSVGEKESMSMQVIAASEQKIPLEKFAD